MQRGPIFPSFGSRQLLGILACAGLLVNPSLSHALSFDLSTITTHDDGITYVQSVFPYNDHANVAISLPKNWTVVAGGNSLALTDPAVPSSTIHLEKSSFAPDTPFKDKGLEAYKAQATAHLPDGSTAVQVVAESADPFIAFGCHDHEFTVDYQFYGQSFRRGVLFININPKEQLVLTMTATKDRFDHVHELAFGILYSWQEMPKH